MEGEAGVEISGEIRVVDLPSAAIAWTIALEPGPLPRDIDAVLSYDRSLLVLKRHADMFAYRPDGTLAWQSSTSGIQGLAGQLSFTPDGSSVGFLTGYLLFCSTATGKKTRTVVYPQMPSRMPDEPRDLLTVTVVGWQGDVPLGGFSEGVLSLSETPRWLLRAPRETRALQVATDRVRWSGRDPGPLDTGPAVNRYRPIINVVGACALGVVIFVLVWWRRRTIKGAPEREDEDAAIRFV